MDSARIQQIITPLPKAGTKSSNMPEGAASGSKDKDVERLEKLINNVSSRIGQISKDKGGKGAKGDKGGKAKDPKEPGSPRSRAPRPRELIGMEITTAKGEPLCFAYNLGGCEKAKDGEKCEKGWHLCSRLKCAKPHGQRSHV